MNENELIEAHRGFVEGLAHKLKRQLKIRVDVEDLIAYGYEGLLQAWRRYDTNAKASFTSFAYYRVRGAMYDGCRKEGWIPRKQAKRARQEPQSCTGQTPLPLLSYFSLSCFAGWESINYAASGENP